MAGADGVAEPGWAVFLDFDGTLADIAEHPDAVVIEPDLPGSLDALRDACGGALAIVTGRSVDVIERFLPGLDLDICGLHGMERRVAGRRERVPVETLALFRATVPALVAPLEGIAGVTVEDKGESVAFHWRQAPAAEARLREAAGRLVASVPGYRAQDGKALVEVVPVVAGKGAAVEALMTLPPYAARRPLFVGDDVTDEHGFAAVNQAGGISVKVGPGATMARRRVASPAALRTALREPVGFLRGLADLEVA